ncbi:Uracil DNA glycosylase superfamily protein [Pirellulimonas nuda]|uniref:Uracil DNA glycosylase superfamily protein n=1 Tax=Pirellulimonas nuda TaxID=2528009 RepID=A0A518D5L3_9BACT|nr:DNA-deoxyinosine glycosylase [Pirellulimonas nuda]QDU86758.1 Uracil DNA glycosylase superfamily protein [Pirellulimonas nuda]
MPIHSFPPIARPDARVLILGSMPGGASLAAREYYAHPRNAFWPIMGELFGAGPEKPYPARCQRLRSQGVAVWDVLAECVRPGSLDARIEPGSEVANDLAGLLDACPRIERVCFNGQKAEQAFARHVTPGLGDGVLRRLTLTRLPSTSPAHAGRTFDQKLAAWRVLKN